MNLRSPMKHASLQHLSRRDRWLHLQRFNGTWIGNVGLLVFIAAAFLALVAGGMLLVRLGVTQHFRGPQQGPVLGAITAMLAIGVGGLVWEGFRRAMVNRALDGSRLCTCGYDKAGLPRDAKCPECGRGAP
jgi:hypothetical protein